ncbi:MAG TPA: hypothetical protein VJ779_20505 [Acetobacteraceae bacterium]|nr:hypothetical protein [Acetobacteraceae bacterium]
MTRIHAVCGLVLALAAAPASLAQPQSAPAGRPAPQTAPSAHLGTATASVAARAQQARPQNYYGMMTEEVARQRLKKLGFQEVPRLEKITPSQGILSAEAVKNGQTRHVEINRLTGVTQEMP